ncbi:4'-phosphopantetheinyl transferase superfamily protein [Nitrosomonas sp. Nm58]|uniref:4'-phosphopantetheinyl transferase family protein n=1 Tax=Nitrosomonas sp. Nm58 TaxID=200126 RepID=UPI00089B2D81|nr:4'-phosphopantetheinyl transferase superfamily protein [Nitrosomonas sp. Nm58]SDY22657.1 4'-phosphopantetheinyl transferase [Nitrosomonas sp. Nm58]
MKRVPLPETIPAGIEVWLLEFDFDSIRLADDWAMLSADEQVRAQRFHRQQDRVRAIATRAALRRLLAERVMLPPNELHFVTGAFGKPHLQAHAGIEFNVSHAGSFALIALSTQGEIGIDIEQRQRDVTHLDAHVLSSVEHAEGIWSSQNFIELWVVKESVLKALGWGIAEYLQAITVRPNHDGGYCIIHDQGEWAGVDAWSIGVPLYYAAALALTHQGKSRVHEYSASLSYAD